MHEYSKGLDPETIAEAKQQSINALMEQLELLLGDRRGMIPLKGYTVYRPETGNTLEIVLADENSSVKTASKSLDITQAVKIEELTTKSLIMRKVNGDWIFSLTSENPIYDMASSTIKILVHLLT